MYKNKKQFVKSTAKCIVKIIHLKCKPITHRFPVEDAALLNSR